MRGFPLLNTLLVVAAFAAAWWPLHQLTGARNPAPPPPQGDSSEAGPITPTLSLRFFAAAPISHLRVESLGQSVIDLAPASGSSDLEHSLRNFRIPAEGIEFWVEADFAPSPGQPGHRPALGIEATPSDPELAPVEVTLWGELGDANIADLAVFTWNPASPSP